MIYALRANCQNLITVLLLKSCIITLLYDDVKKCKEVYYYTS